MKKTFLLSLFTFMTVTFSFAQNVAINADATLPNSSAMLDVNSTNKGLLIPRVTLTGTNDAFTIPSPATSLLVYNTTAAGSGGTAVTAGYYYWTGTAWVQLATGSSSGSTTTSWLLTGNAGTFNGINFIGTTDNVPFNVRVNNQKAGRIDGTSGNTFWGYQAGNSTTASINTATGYRALFTNTTGGFNTATGYAALLLNTTGGNNTATGWQAMQQNTSGLYNTAIGTNALNSNTTGDSNTGLGNYADVSAGNLSNATVIGSGATVNASNKVRIGNYAVTVIEGSAPFSIVSDARFKYTIKNNVPGLDFIKKLQPVTYYFDEKKLDEYSRTGILKNSIAQNASYAGERQLRTGFLAQDVEKIAKDLGYSFDGVHTPANKKDNYSIAYSQFIMPLVKGMQEQQLIIEKLSKQVEQSEIPAIFGKQQIIIEQQKKDIDILKLQVEELSKAVKKLTQK